MENSQASFMCTKEGRKVPLMATIADVVLHDLLANVTINQVYKNSEEKNIEAIYSFPLPRDAVLMELSVIWNDRKLQGKVVGKKAAEARYEEAIVDGDRAVMLEKVEDGLYTMNIGNLLPDENIEVVIRYSLLHRWQGDQLRFYLPTTVAPRYGIPMMEPHQIPAVDILTKNRFSFSLKVIGEIREAEFESPSHAIINERHHDHRLIRLVNETTLMDRDLIINIRSKGQGMASAVYDSDGDNFVSLVSFKPVLSSDNKPESRALTILVDCSGSMSGNSMTQARIALQRILGSLKSSDLFNIIKFGSRHRSLFPSLELANLMNREKAETFISNINANMGGTEINAALREAYHFQQYLECCPDILLITDGEICSAESIIQEAKESGSRIFSVGVGSSVAEAFVEGIARETGGACELVTPNEDMAERIYRHAKRINGERYSTVEVSLPVACHEQIPAKVRSVFDGDTVHLFLRSKVKPVGDAIISLHINSEPTWRSSVPLIQVKEDRELTVSSLARMAAYSSLSELGREEATEVALQYQLMSEWTNFLMIDERAEGEPADALPELRPVPHMLATGWGGTPTNYDESNLSIPGWIRKTADCDPKPPVNDRTSSRPVNDRTSSRKSVGTKSLWPSSSMALSCLANPTMDVLVEYLPEAIAKELQALVALGYKEKAVVLCFVQLLKLKFNVRVYWSRVIQPSLSKELKALKLESEFVEKLTAIGDRYFSE